MKRDETPLFSCRNLHVTVAAKEIVKGVDLDIGPAQEWVTLLDAILARQQGRDPAPVTAEGATVWALSPTVGWRDERHGPRS